MNKWQTSLEPLFTHLPSHVIPSMSFVFVFIIFLCQRQSLIWLSGWSSQVSMRVSCVCWGRTHWKRLDIKLLLILIDMGIGQQLAQKTSSDLIWVTLVEKSSWVLQLFGQSAWRLETATVSVLQRKTTCPLFYILLSRACYVQISTYRSDMQECNISNTLYLEEN